MNPRKAFCDAESDYNSRVLNMDSWGVFYGNTNGAYSHGTYLRAHATVYTCMHRQTSTIGSINFIKFYGLIIALLTTNNELVYI